MNGKLDDTMDKGQLKISGGTFNAGANEPVIDMMKGSGCKDIGDISISAGTFSAKPEADMIAAGYGVYAENDKFVVRKVEATDVEADVVVAAPDVTVKIAGLTDEEKQAVEESAKTLASEGLAEVAEAITVTDGDKADAIEKLTEKNITIADDTVTVVVEPYFEVKATAYETSTTASALTFDIKPMYNLKATVADANEEMTDNNTVTLKEAQPMKVTDPITLTITLPEGFAPQLVRHVKADKATYYYGVTMNGSVATFTVQKGFSEFTFLQDDRTVVVNFDQNVGKQSYTIADLTKALPTVNNSRFKGWKFDGVEGVHTALTEALWAALADKGTVNATAQFSSSGGSSSGGSSGGGGGGAAVAQKITVSTPDSDVKITQSSVSDSLIESVKKAVADNKDVQVVGNSSTAVQITAKKDNVTLTSFDNPLTVTIPVSNSLLNNVKDTSKLTLAQVTKDANGAIVLTYVGGNYNADKKTFTAYVDEPGNYVLLADANVQKIELQIGNRINKVNGTAIANDVAPIIVNSRTMVPLRFVSETLGGQVDWNEATRTVTIHMDGMVMGMTIDQVINGFDVAPVIRNERTMVPVRYIAEKLGANVIYVPLTQEIVIVK